MVSALGVGYPALLAFLQRPHASSDVLLHADSLTSISSERIPQAVAAEVRDFDARDYLGPKGLRNFDRLTRYLLVSAKLALRHAGVKGEDGAHRILPNRIGLCSATAYGSLDVIHDMVHVVELEDPHFLNPGQFPNTVINSAAGYVSIWEDMQAPNVTVVDGNCGALDAFFTAGLHLEAGRADAFLVGGGEVLSEPLYLAFRKLGLLADRGQRRRIGEPSSGGMLLGEGGAYMCLEREEDARARGARIHAVAAGYGTAIELPESEAVIVHVAEQAVERAVKSALDDAGVAPADIDLVCASCSGVPAFDAPELAALARVLPGVAVTAPKAWLGETLGAGGAFGVVCGLAFLEGAPVRPLLFGELPNELRHVLVVSTGYYGNVSALVLRRGDRPATS